MEQGPHPMSLRPVPDDEKVMWRTTCIGNASDRPTTVRGPGIGLTSSRNSMGCRSRRLSSMMWASPTCPTVSRVPAGMSAAGGPRVTPTGFVLSRWSYTATRPLRRPTSSTNSSAISHGNGGRHGNFGLLRLPIGFRLFRLNSMDGKPSIPPTFGLSGSDIFPGKSREKTFELLFAWQIRRERVEMGAIAFEPAAVTLLGAP